MGCLTLGSLKGCKILYSLPKFSGTSSSDDEWNVWELVLPKSVSSWGCIPVQLSEILCTHVCGLQIAVVVGLEGVTLKGKGLETPAPALVAVMIVEVVLTAGVVVIVGVSMVSPPVVVAASLIDLVCSACSSPFPGAKKCLVDSNASSWLASLAH